MNLTYHIVAFVVLVIAVAGLYLYRKMLDDRDDHNIHLHNDAHDAGIVNTQTAMAKRLEIVDKLKNAGLVAVVLYGLTIAGMAVYLGWSASQQVQ